MRRILKKSFFNRDSALVAQELLGKFLVRKVNGKPFDKAQGKETAFMIIEVEAYDGLHDKASHASKGKTTRTEVMFGQPGVFYVYLCYGMYYMLNIVTREHGYPAAILIRGVSTFTHWRACPPKPSACAIHTDRWRRREWVNGPGKVTRLMQINKTLNAKAAKKSSGLWFEDRGIVVPAARIKKTPRIGVGYADPVWATKKLRFFINNNL